MLNRSDRPARRGAAIYVAAGGPRLTVYHDGAVKVAPAWCHHIANPIPRTEAALILRRMRQEGRVHAARHFLRAAFSPS